MIPWRKLLPRSESQGRHHRLDRSGDRHLRHQPQLHEIGDIRLELIGAVLNALDDEQVTHVCGQVTGCGGVSLGDALRVRQPRFYEAGDRVEW